MNVWLVLLLIGSAITASLWLRTSHIRRQLDAAGASPSPLSQAIQELVGTAGGIYLSMVALISFLKIDIPERITVFHVAFDPLAFIAIAIAVAQPIVIRLFYKEGR